MGDIITTEFGYYLLSELVTMKDRKLAAAIELKLWPNSPTVDEKVLSDLITLLKDSDCDEDFADRAKKLLGL